MFKEEPQHLFGGIRTTRIGEGPGRAAAEPRMPGTTDAPVLDHRLSVAIDLQRPCVGVAAWNLPCLDPGPQRRPLHRLCGDRVTVAHIDGGIPFAVKNDGWDET